MDRCIERLPAPFCARLIGPATVVVGPTGVFVVLVHDGTPDRARALTRLAATIRSAFAERMAWVPFVHALLVHDTPTTMAQTTVVPPDLLRDVLTEGRRTLEDETIATIRALMAEGVLDGLEAVAPAGTADIMQECLESPAATASSWPSTNSVPIRRALLSSSPTPPGSTAGSGHPSPTR